MKACARAAALTLAVGCGGPIPVYLTTTTGPSSPDLHPDDEASALLDEAFGLWGLTWEISGKRYGAVSIELIELEESAVVHGRSHPGRCRPELWVDAGDAIALAHELGHIWLWRADVPAEEAHDGATTADVMHEAAVSHRGTDIDNETHQLADFGLRRLLSCRGRSDGAD